MPVFDRLREALRRFRRREDGSMTIEAMLWIPFLFTLILLGVQATLISTAQSRVMRIVQDGNRGFALGRYDNNLAIPTGSATATATATQAAVLASVQSISPNATVASSVNSSKVITTTVTMPATDLSVFTILPDSLSMNLTVTAQQIKEY
jgi:Flp pilus assembly protein TadG